MAKSFEEESYKLPEEGLLEYARLATKLRNQFTEKAEAAKVKLAAQPEDKEEVKELVELKLYRSKGTMASSKKLDVSVLGFEAKFDCK